MKRCILVLISFILISFHPAEASPCWGTQMPDKGKSFWGIQHYSVERRNMESDRGSVNSQQNFLTWNYGLSDWFSLDLKDTLYSTFRTQDPEGDMKYKNAVWGGGYGFRIRLYESGPVKVVTGFQHFSIHPKTVKANGVRQNGILEDWQGSVLASYDFKRVIPYAGVRYDSMDYISDLDHTRSVVMSDEHRRIGGILGVDVPLTKRLWLNVETDWQDGGSLTTGILYRF